MLYSNMYRLRRIAFHSLYDPEEDALNADEVFVSQLEDIFLLFCGGHKKNFDLKRHFTIVCLLALATVIQCSDQGQVLGWIGNHRQSRTPAELSAYIGWSPLVVWIVSISMGAHKIFDLERSQQLYQEAIGNKTMGSPWPYNSCFA